MGRRHSDSGQRQPVRRLRPDAGITILEVVVVATMVSVLLAASYSQWEGHKAQQRLRYGTIQVTSDLRQAQERAKYERRVYAVTFTASSGAYTIAGGAFSENALLPKGVTVTASETVTFSAFGRPDSAHTITVQNSMGTGTASVNTTGGITYQAP